MQTIIKPNFQLENLTPNLSKLAHSTNVGEIFTVTLTKVLEIRRFQGGIRKVYFTTVEGFFILLTRENEILLKVKDLAHFQIKVIVCEIQIDQKMHKYLKFESSSLFDLLNVLGLVGSCD